MCWESKGSSLTYLSYSISYFYEFWLVSDLQTKQDFFSYQVQAKRIMIWIIIIWNWTYFSISYFIVLNWLEPWPSIGLIGFSVLYKFKCNWAGIIPFNWLSCSYNLISFVLDLGVNFMLVFLCLFFKIKTPLIWNQFFNYRDNVFLLMCFSEDLKFLKYSVRNEQVIGFVIKFYSACFCALKHISWVGIDRTRFLSQVTIPWGDLTSGRSRCL